MAKLVSNNTYSNILQVNWDKSNKYIGETTLDEETFEEITVWKTNSGTIATSGYYLSVDKKPNGTYIVQLLNLTFINGVIQGNFTNLEALYKLSNTNFQSNESYYVKNSNNFEELKVNQGQCTFTTDPTTDNNFYIYQKGIEPWTSAPPLPRLVYYYSGTKWYYPLITKTGTLTWNGYIYSYDKSIGDTFGVALNNTKYVVPNKRVSAVTYDIPAGTYIGQGAYNTFKKFISDGSYRILKYSVTIVHMGTARTFPAGTAVWLIYGYSGQCINLTFQISGTPAAGVDAGYGSYNSLWSSSSNNPVIQLRVYNGQGFPTPWSWNNFTITDGIKFK